MKLIYQFLFVLFLVIITFLLFGDLGFNPTDEGFILSGSNYILEGYVPHKDFISIRPVGSYILHTIDFLFGKSNLILVSRFIFLLQISIISLLIFNIMFIYIEPKLKNLFFLLLLFVTFIFTINNFPLMAWHTVDGLMFSLIGIFLILSKHKKIGYLLIGMSVLCKQNFIYLIVLFLLLNKDHKNIKDWIFSTIPIIAYITIIYFFGGFSNMILQLSSSSFLESLFFWNIYMFFVIVLGIIISFIIKNTSKLLSLYYILVILFSFLCMILGGLYWEYGCLLVYGIILGEFIFSKWVLRRSSNFLGLLSILGFVTSISFGYVYPSFILYFVYRLTLLIKSRRKLLYIFYIFLIVLSMFTFSYIRLENIYRDLEHDELSYNLNDHLECGEVYTNYNVYSSFAELKIIEDQLNKNFIVLPDYSIWSFCSEQKIFVSHNWPQNTEMRSEMVYNSFVSELSNKDVYFVISKYEISRLSEDLFEPKEYKISKYIRDNYELLYDYNYFEIYG